LPSLTGVDTITGNNYTINNVRVSVSDITSTVTRTNINSFSSNYGTSFQQADVNYVSSSFSPATTSFTIPTTNNNPTNANSGAPVLQYGHTYSVDIQLENVVSGRTVSRSNSFFDYTPQTASSLGLPANAVINLPTVTPISAIQGGTSPYLYSFNVANVSSSSVTYIDPLIATGYIYTVGQGDPFFATVTPISVVGSGLYKLSIWDGTAFELVDAALAAGQTFDFRTLLGFANGVSEFEITGIDPGLDPNNISAFVTGLTFVGDGSFTGTMQPIVESVPGPVVGAGLPGIILGAGFFLACLRSRRRNRDATTLSKAA